MTLGLLDGSFDEVKDRLDSRYSTWVSAMDASLSEAVAGDRLAARTYATAFTGLVEVVSKALSDELAEQRRSEAGWRSWLVRVARREAIALPFRARMVDERPGLSVALLLLADLRRVVPEGVELEWPAVYSSRLHSHLQVTDKGVSEFERVVDRVIDASGDPLEEIADTFALSNTEMGRLFGVSRQAIAQWLRDGVPSDRKAKVVTVVQVATLLRQYLKAERIPGIARKPAPVYGGGSLLDMITEDRHEELLELTRRSFDWATTA